MSLVESEFGDFSSGEVEAARSLVSVVLPTYNSRDFAGRAIDSVLSQEGSFDLELIIVDDCSRDGTREYLDQIYGADRRVRFLSTPHNGGPAHARNIGFADARGDWIAIIDADDAWRENRLATLLGHCEDYDLVFDNIIGFDFREKVETGPLLPEGPLDITIDTMVDNSARAGHDLGFVKPIFRRRFLQENGLTYPDLRCNEDLLFYLAILIAGGRASYLPEGLYIYTTRVGAISRALSAVSRSEADNAAAATALRQLATEHRNKLSDGQVALIEKRANELVRDAPIARFYDDWAAMRIGKMSRALLDQRGLGPALARKLFRKIRRTVMPKV